jgi:hypothetical protein
MTRRERRLIRLKGTFDRLTKPDQIPDPLIVLERKDNRG